jgi:hypothetical protein
MTIKNDLESYFSKYKTTELYVITLHLKKCDTLFTVIVNFIFKCKFVWMEYQNVWNLYIHMLQLTSTHFKNHIHGIFKRILDQHTHTNVYFYMNTNTNYYRVCTLCFHNSNFSGVVSHDKITNSSDEEHVRYLKML